MKTINEAAKEATQKRSFSTLDTPMLKEKFYDGFLDGVEFAQRWRSVDDEMPENDEYVLLLCKTATEGPFMAVRRKDNFWITSCWRVIFEKMVDVTHWRPIELN